MILSIEHDFDFIVLAMNDQCKVERFVSHLLRQGCCCKLVAAFDPVDPEFDEAKLALNLIANVSAYSNISLNSSFVQVPVALIRSYFSRVKGAIAKNES